jgi:hypothetical protein
MGRVKGAWCGLAAGQRNGRRACGRGAAAGQGRWEAIEAFTRFALQSACKLGVQFLPCRAALMPSRAIGCFMRRPSIVDASLQPPNEYPSGTRVANSQAYMH